MNDCLIVCLLLLLIKYAHARTTPASYAYVKGQRTDEVQGNGHRPYRHRLNVYAPSACHPRLHTAETPPPACHIVNDWGFLYATPSDGIYTGCPSHLSPATAHRLLSVRRSTPRDARTKRQHNTHCELYGGLIMLTSRTTTPPPLLSPNGYAGT